MAVIRGWSPRAFVAWGAAALCTACSVAGLVLQVLTHDTVIPLDFGTRQAVAVLAVVFIVMPIVGALVAVRRPESPIGWLFITIGATMAVWVVCDGGAVYALRTRPGSFGYGAWLAWVANWISIVGWGLTGLVFLLFPTGALPSPRWSPVAWAVAVVTGVFTAVSALLDGPLANYTFVENPAGVLQIGASPTAVKLAGTIAMALVGFAAVASLVVRARRATGDERQQVRWLEWSAMVVVGVIAAFAVLRALGGRLAWAESWALVVAAVIPISAGIAVLKYRLYGISVVIRKTVVFGVLAAFITAVYATLVVGVGALIGAPDQPTPVLSIIATAVVAVAFDPVRTRARSLANRIVYGERVAPYEALSEFAQQVSGGIDLDEALEQMARVIAGGVGARTVSVWLCYDGQLDPAGRWPDSADDPPLAPVPVTGATLPDLAPSGRAFPVRHEGELLGAVVVDMGPADDLDAGGVQLVTDLAAQAGLVLRNVGLVAELRASRQRVVAAGDQARRRIERDLHDGAQAQLFALSLKLRLLSSMLDKDIDKARGLASELSTDAGEALRNLRDLARGIYPPLLADRGLVHALTAQAEKMPVPTTVEGVDVGRYDQHVEAAVYFCCLEALQNIAKYAQASRAMVSLRGGDGRIALRVQDDGRGFDPALAHGSGVRNMADRLASLGGSLEVVSAPGAGCTVTGWAAVDTPAASDGDRAASSADGTGSDERLGRTNGESGDGGAGGGSDRGGSDGHRGGDPTGVSAADGASVHPPVRFASIGSRATRRVED